MTSQSSFRILVNQLIILKTDKKKKELSIYPVFYELYFLVNEGSFLLILANKQRQTNRNIIIIQ